MSQTNAVHDSEPVAGPNTDSGTESEGDVPGNSWSLLEQDVENCDRCVLHETRKQPLIGRGSRSAELMFVLLAPDTSDDLMGMICSDAADDLFTRMLAAIDIEIEDVYITSLLKCAVPASHTVSPKEIRCCTEHLKQQVQLIQPELIVVLGETAIRCLLQKDLTLDDYRAMNPDKDNRDLQYQFESVPLFVSYSPHELLKQLENKRKAWSDLQQLQAMMSGEHS
ncbi:MAG: uracil-DNA glycosylase [Gammaproteobacteria bacterium]|nr:uracil-DNA glycosylase [Gammaproteobacteria bacterium]